MKSLKSLLYLTVVILLSGGCSYKNELVNLEPYKADYAGTILNNGKPVYLQVVKDARQEKQTIGYTLQDGKKAFTLYSNTDFAKKYKKGFLQALHMAGFNTHTVQNGTSWIIRVYITKLEVVYDEDTWFDENLHGDMEVKVIIQKGNKKFSQSFQQKLGKWIMFSSTSKDLEPFLSQLVSNSINGVVSNFANTQ